MKRQYTTMRRLFSYAGAATSITMSFLSHHAYGLSVKNILSIEDSHKPDATSIEYKKTKIMQVWAGYGPLPWATSDTLSQVAEIIWGKSYSWPD